MHGSENRLSHCCRIRTAGIRTAVAFALLAFALLTLSHCWHSHCWLRTGVVRTVVFRTLVGIPAEGVIDAMPMTDGAGPGLSPFSGAPAFQQLPSRK